MSVLKKQCVEKSISGLHGTYIMSGHILDGERKRIHYVKKRLVCQAAELYNHKINLIVGSVHFDD